MTAIKAPPQTSNVSKLPTNHPFKPGTGVPRKNAGGDKDQVSDQTSNIEAVWPPPDEATAPSIQCVRGEPASRGLIDPENAEVGDSIATVDATELTLKAASRGKRRVSRIRGLRADGNRWKNAARKK